MVLMKPICAVLFLLLSGCLPKTSLPVLLPESSVATEVSLQDNRGEWAPASQELSGLFQETFAAFGEASAAPEARLTFELSARYFSQLQGQHRWTVSGSVSLFLSSEDSAEPTASTPVELAVFLDYPHEGEEEALQAALPLLQREVQDLIQGATPTPPSSN